MTHAALLDFDAIDVWHPQLTHVLSALLPADIETQLIVAKPEFIEDARDLVFQLGEPAKIIDATIDWIRQASLLAYHGTRLSDDDVQNIRANGLKPLVVEQRRARILRALSTHPKWNTVIDRLDSVLRDHGPHRNMAGPREGSVHLTLSRTALTKGFNHYLTHGAEVDQHIAHALLGQEGVERLRHDGRPWVISVRMAGAAALDAAHPYSSIDEIRTRGEAPNIIRDVLEAWSYRLAYPNYQSRTLEIDSGLVFRHLVATSWIYNIESLTDEALQVRPLSAKEG